MKYTEQDLKNAVRAYISAVVEAEGVAFIDRIEDARLRKIIESVDDYNAKKKEN